MSAFFVLFSSELNSFNYCLEPLFIRLSIAIKSFVFIFTPTPNPIFLDYIGVLFTPLTIHKIQKVCEITETKVKTKQTQCYYEEK